MPSAQAGIFAGALTRCEAQSARRRAEPSRAAAVCRRGWTPRQADDRTDPDELMVVLCVVLLIGLTISLFARTPPVGWLVDHHGFLAAARNSLVVIEATAAPPAQSLRSCGCWVPW